MKALQKVDASPSDLVLRDVDEPKVNAGLVKIAVQSGGICGTDMHIRDGGYGSNPPVTLGHEICGDVVEVGLGVNTIAVGDRVTVNPTANNACGECRFCHQGTYFFCENRKSIGSGINGGFAEYLIAPADLTFTLPDSICYDAGAMVEPFACCVKAVTRLTQISPGDVVLVCGPGPIGLMCAWLVKHSGATTVVAGTNADGDRLRAAVATGVEAINVEQADVVEMLKSLSDGYGADAVIDCGGTRGSVNQCLQAAANCAQFTQVALIDHPFEIDWGRIVYKQLRIQGSIAADWPSWEQAIHMVRSGQVDLKQFVSHRHALEDWKTGFANAEEKVGLKQILTPA